MHRRFCHGLCLLLLATVGVVPARVALAEEEPRGTLAARVHVRGDGFVRVGPATLRELGIGAAARCVVERRGVRVPVCRSPADGALVFLAEQTQSRNTATAVFEVRTLGVDAPRPPALDVSPVGESPEASVHPRVRVDAADRLFGPVDGGVPAIYAHDMPTWFLHRLDHQGQVSQALDPGEARGEQMLTVRLYGTYVHPVALRAVWGTSDLGLAQVDHAAGGADLHWRVPMAALPSGRAPLVLTNRSPALPPKPGNDLSRGRGRLWIDSVGLRGRAALTLGSELAVWQLEGKAPLLLRYPQGPEATYALHFATTRRVAGSVPPPARAGLYALPGSFAGRFVAGAARAPHHVERAREVDPLAAAGAARHVIVATPALLEGAQRLAAHRSEDGLPSVAIDVRDVYARYGGGAQDEAALRAFVAALQARDVALDYLLLAGDAIHDRTDWSRHPLIPPPMARTLWNGATPSDALYAGPIQDDATKRTAVGRLPFRRAGTMDRYVARLIDHETRSRPDPRRRVMRFFAGSTDMGQVVDSLFERAFRSVLDEFLDPAFDVEVTNANPRSPYYWPLFDLNSKVLGDLNEGSLLYAYVGHGTPFRGDIPHAWDGNLELMTVRETKHVQIRGVRPIMLVLASSTAVYDLPKREGIGESLLKQPEGPLAYWGATRFCNPIFNCLIAAGLAKHVGTAERVGDLLEGARAMLYAKPQSTFAKLVLQFSRVSWPDMPEERIRREGVSTYTLLGDPALRMLQPRRGIRVQSKVEGRRVLVTVEGDVPRGTEVVVRLLRRRNDATAEPAAVENAADPAQAAAVRTVHAKVNDHGLASKSATWTGKALELSLTIPDGFEPTGLRVIALATTKDDVILGVDVIK